MDGSLSFLLLLDSIGSGAAGRLGASRLHFGMGRDGVVPKNIFRNLDKKHSSPNYNILIVGSWMIAGIVLLAVRTNGFRKTNAMIDF